MKYFLLSDERESRDVSTIKWYIKRNSIDARVYEIDSLFTVRGDEDGGLRTEIQESLKMILRRKTLREDICKLWFINRKDLFKKRDLRKIFEENAPDSVEVVQDFEEIMNIIRIEHKKQSYEGTENKWIRVKKDDNTILETYAVIDIRKINLSEMRPLEEVLDLLIETIEFRIEKAKEEEKKELKKDLQKLQEYRKAMKDDEEWSYEIYNGYEIGIAYQIYSGVKSCVTNFPHEFYGRNKEKIEIVILKKGKTPVGRFVRFKNEIDNLWYVPRIYFSSFLPQRAKEKFAEAFKDCVTKNESARETRGMIRIEQGYKYEASLDIKGVSYIPYLDGDLRINEQNLIEDEICLLETIDDTPERITIEDYENPETIDGYRNRAKERGYKVVHRGSYNTKTIDLDRSEIQPIRISLLRKFSYLKKEESVRKLGSNDPHDIPSYFQLFIKL